MELYRKINSDVHAIQWEPPINYSQVIKEGETYFFLDPRGIRIAINPGDWIVHFSATDHRVLPNTFFRQHYAPVDLGGKPQ